MPGAIVPRLLAVAPWTKGRPTATSRASVLQHHRGEAAAAREDRVCVTSMHGDIASRYISRTSLIV
jgi:hypothetical protein